MEALKDTPWTKPLTLTLTAVVTGGQLHHGFREPESTGRWNAVKLINKSKMDSVMAEVSLEELNARLGRVIDPELGRPITDLKLIDKLEVSGGKVGLEFHLTAPFCPPVFALKIAADIKSALISTPNVTEAVVTLRGHYLAEAVNKQVNKPASPVS